MARIINFLAQTIKIAARAEATLKASQKGNPAHPDTRTPAMTSTALQIRNSIIDNKLLRLSAETVPLKAISSIRICQEPVRGFALLFGGFCAFLSTWTLIEQGSDQIIIIVAAICYCFFFAGLKTVLNPQYFLLLNLHSGRSISINVASRQQAIQAEADLQNALLGNPVSDIDITPTVSAQPTSRPMRPRLGY